MTTTKQNAAGPGPPWKWCVRWSTFSPAFNPLIEHFLLRAWREEGIDQLIMHMTAIDAAIGNREFNKNWPKKKKYDGLTKALGTRMCALLTIANAEIAI